MIKRRLFSILTLAILVISLLGTLTLPVQASTKFDYYESYDNYQGTYGALWTGQTFTASVTYLASSVEMRLWKVGTPGNWTASLRLTDGNGAPTGGDLAVGTIDTTSMSTSEPGVWYTVTFDTPYVVSEGTKYAIVGRAPSGGSSNKINWEVKPTTGSYSGGCGQYSANSGSTWNYALWATWDYTFRVNGDQVYPATGTMLTPTDVTGTSATLRYSLTGLGNNTWVNVSFKYGYTDDAYELETDYEYDSSATNYTSVPQSVSKAISGLIPGQRIYYRIILDGDVGDYTGVGYNFWTSSPPATVAEDNYVSRQGAITHVFQRKGFYAAGRYWLIYCKGASASPTGGFYYKSSSNGLTWSDPYLFIEAENTPNTSGNEADELNVYFDGTYLHGVYVWNRYDVEYDEGSEIWYRRGVPNADGTITWTAAWAKALDNDNTTVKGYASIVTDTNGYPWIDYWQSESYVGGDPGGSNYGTPNGSLDRYVIKSSTKDGTFTIASGYPYLLKAAIGNRGTGTLVQLTGGKLYWVGCMEFLTHVVGRLYNGTSWEDEVAIASDAVGFYRFSVVARGDIVHVIYSDGSGQLSDSVKYTKRLDTGWTTPVTIISGLLPNDYDHMAVASMSINQATGDLYVFWIDWTTNADKIYYIECPYDTGVWGDATELVDESCRGIVSDDLSTYLGSYMEVYGGKLGVYYVQSYPDWIGTTDPAYMDLRFTYLQVEAGAAVQTNEAADITVSSATLQGYLINDGGQTTQVRFEWGTSIAYGSTTTWQSKGTAETFTASLTGLSANTLYFFRAVAKWADGTTTYGTGRTFTTSSYGTPTVSTGTAAGITPSSATIQGSITSMGDYSTVYVSFQWGLTGSYEQSPTSEQTKTAIGGFSASLSGLSANTLYYFRAVLRYGSTTIYGSQQTFTTSAAGVPSVSTASAASIMQTSATIQGTVSSMGDYSTVYVSFQWGLTVGYEQSPTAEQTKTSTGGFSASLSGLIAGTQYYYRAALRYGSTTIYGSQGTFTTTASGGEPGIDPPDVLRIDDVKVFSGYFEDNDQLYVINYRVVYTVGDPTFDVGDYFDLELLDGALIRAKVPVSSWGYRPGSIYLKASSALLWGEDYTIRLIGNANKWESPPYDDFTLDSGDWLGDDLNQLDSWVIALGKSIQTYYDVQLVDYAQGVPYLTEQGTVVFSMGIPGLCQVRPNLCSSYVSYPGIPTEQNEVPVIDTEAETGSTVYGFLEDVADFLNMDDPSTAGGLIFGGGFFLIGILLTVVLGGAGQMSGLAGMAIASPILIYGGKLGLIPMQLIVILAAIAVVYSLVIIWLKGQ